MPGLSTNWYGLLWCLIIPLTASYHFCRFTKLISSGPKAGCDKVAEEEVNAPESSGVEAEGRCEEDELLDEAEAND